MKRLLLFIPWSSHPWMKRLLDDMSQSSFSPISFILIRNFYIKNFKIWTDQLFFVAFLTASLLYILLQEQYISWPIMYVVGLLSKDLCNVSKHVFKDFPYFFSPRHDHYKKPGYAIFFSISIVNVKYSNTIIYKKIKFSLPKSSIIYLCCISSYA
jgi:hypothetical protein